MSDKLRLARLDDLGLYHPSAQEVLDVQAKAQWGLFYDYRGRRFVEDMRLVLELNSVQGDMGCSLVTFAVDAIQSIHHHVEYKQPAFVWAHKVESMTRSYLHPGSRLAQG